MCEPGSQRVGTVVLQPNGKNDEVAFQVVTHADGGSVEACTLAQSYQGCIVARRQLKYKPRATLRVRVDLRLSCKDMPCDQGSETCAKGRCIEHGSIRRAAAKRAATRRCRRCLRSRTRHAGSSSTSTAGRNPRKRSPARCSGRYVYFAPRWDNRFLVRYDATRPFLDALSWEAVSLVSVVPAQRYFAVQAGRYVYFVPEGGTTVLRYDTGAGFAPSSFATFDLAMLGRMPSGFLNMGAFDGRYLYVGDHGVRYDTSQAFADVSAWQQLGCRECAEPARGVRSHRRLCLRRSLSLRLGPLMAGHRAVRHWWDLWKAPELAVTFRFTLARIILLGLIVSVLFELSSRSPEARTGRPSVR